MKTSEFGNTVLSDQETLKMLQGFCYEALRFLKVSVEKFPKFAVGVAMQADGKADCSVLNKLTLSQSKRSKNLCLITMNQRKYCYYISM